MGLKIFYDIVPGVSQETSWTLTNISYMAGSYLMFHYVRGVPFEFNAGAYDNLNMWEQIDDGAQYTPAKKFLLSVPIVLFLLSTHYTHYDLAYFTINFLAVLAVVIPKLPFVRPPIGLELASFLWWTRLTRRRVTECDLGSFQACLRRRRVFLLSKLGVWLCSTCRLELGGVEVEGKCEATGLWDFKSEIRWSCTKELMFTGNQA